MIDDKSDDERNRYKFPTQAKNATYGYINLPCDSRVRLLGGASIPGLQNLLGMTARPIVSVDWAGPLFRTQLMQRASLPGAFSKKFSAMDWRTPSCSAFVIYLPNCYLTTWGSPACQPLCIICGPSSLVPGDAFHFVRRKKVKCAFPRRLFTLMRSIT